MPQTVQVKKTKDENQRFIYMFSMYKEFCGLYKVNLSRYHQLKREMLNDFGSPQWLTAYFNNIEKRMQNANSY